MGHFSIILGYLLECGFADGNRWSPSVRVERGILGRNRTEFSRVIPFLIFLLKLLHVYIVNGLFFCADEKYAAEELLEDAQAKFADSTKVCNALHYSCPQPHGIFFWKTLNRNHQVNGEVMSL